MQRARRASELRRSNCCVLTARRARSAEQRLGFAHSSFVAWEFQQTVAGYFGIDPLLVVIVSVFPGGATVTIVRYVVYFPTLILAQNFCACPRYGSMLQPACAC
jgi:hypothetical protein